MFMVKRRTQVVRFGLFLVLMGLMAIFVSSRLERFRSALAKPYPETPAPQLELVQSAAINETDLHDFFVEFRLDRERLRGAYRESLKEVMESQGTDDETRKQASQRYLASGQQIAVEDQAESMVKAKGFTDVIVSLTEGAAQVVVRARGLTQQQSLQVVELVSRVTGTKPSGIAVISRER